MNLLFPGNRNVAAFSGGICIEVKKLFKTKTPESFCFLKNFFGGKYSTLFYDHDLYTKLNLLYFYFGKYLCQAHNCRRQQKNQLRLFLKYDVNLFTVLFLKKGNSPLTVLLSFILRIDSTSTYFFNLEYFYHRTGFYCFMISAGNNSSFIFPSTSDTK